MTEKANATVEPEERPTPVTDFLKENVKTYEDLQAVIAQFAVDQGKDEVAVGSLLSILYNLEKDGVED